jgi:hypothetical protein
VNEVLVADNRGIRAGFGKARIDDFYRRVPRT